MDTFYTDERNTQILISLMKAHGIKKVVASPGATNVCFVASIQQDPYFEVYSSVDERSAAYIACGLSAESGEPVALSCTGATASRNYIPGLTEAFYRKLPILAITSAQHIGRIGNNIPQVIDRTALLNDIAKMSVQIPTIHDKEDEWAYTVMLNKALLELQHHGCGPVHINLVTTYSPNYSVKELPAVPVINRFTVVDTLPDLPDGKIGIFVGAHKEWSKELTDAVDAFCEAYNAVVFCDHTSNYTGKYCVFANLILDQKSFSPLDVMIHIGDISGAYLNINPTEVWRVNPDGEIRDTFRCLRYIFEMEEILFFKEYIRKADGKTGKTTYYDEWENECNEILKKIPELPFSNVWIAQHTIDKLPEGCRLHLGILNSLRTWNFFKKSKSIFGFANTGGFGIDGVVSSLIGASLAKPDKLFFCVVGDLAFFYDLNSIGNRHVKNNIRILLVNNGKGTEFRNYFHRAAKFGEDADTYIAAAGHYGQQSSNLVRHYAEDLGFEYLSARSKDEYLRQYEHFVSPEMFERPILFEVFTDSRDESDALRLMYSLESAPESDIKKVAKKIIGDKGIDTLKKLIKR